MIRKTMFFPGFQTTIVWCGFVIDETSQPNPTCSSWLMLAAIQSVGRVPTTKSHASRQRRWGLCLHAACMCMGQAHGSRCPGRAKHVWACMGLHAPPCRVARTPVVTRAALGLDPASLLKGVFKKAPAVRDAAYTKSVIEDEAKYVLQVSHTGSCSSS